MDFTGAILCWITAFILGVTAFLLSRLRMPFPFFAGVNIPAEKITDVKAYNRTSGKMWAVYSGIYVLAGCLALINSTLGFILFGLLMFPGLVVMFFFHKRILNRFKNPESKPYY